MIKKRVSLDGAKAPQAAREVLKMKNGYFITAIFSDGSTADYTRGILADLLADADVCAVYDTRTGCALYVRAKGGRMVQMPAAMEAAR